MYDFDVWLMTHNHLELTICCLEGNNLSDGLFKNTPNFQFRLTVLDDSTDLTPQYFRRLSKAKDNIQYLRPKRPFKNPSEVLNLALDNTDCPYIVLMGNSVMVEPSWIGSALQVMEMKPKAAVVGLKIVKHSGVIESAGVILYDNDMRSIGLNGPGHRFSSVYTVDAVGFATCLFRREAIKDGFESGYYLPFGGFEDIDCCLSLKEKGWEIWFCGYGAVYHDGAATRRQDPDFWLKFNENKKRFHARWQHLLDRDVNAIKVSQL